MSHSTFSLSKEAMRSLEPLALSLSPYSILLPTGIITTWSQHNMGNSDYLLTQHVAYLDLAFLSLKQLT